MTSPPAKPRQSSKTGTAGPTLADRVARLLAQQIRTGVYPVDARLPTESAMSEQYGVSRTVVREAVSRLRSDGLVETRQGSGTVVCDPRVSDAFRLTPSPDGNPAQGVLQILELRRGIEAEMAALAAERRSAAEMKRIQASCPKKPTLVSATRPLPVTGANLDEGVVVAATRRTRRTARSTTWAQGTGRRGERRYRRGVARREAPVRGRPPLHRADPGCPVPGLTVADASG